MSSDSILAIDVGGGTQDILLWEPCGQLENCVKLILPTPTRIVAQRIRRSTSRGEHIFLDGRVMGGGPVSRAVTDHLRAGLKAYALPSAAVTFHDNLDYVRNMGVVITDSPPTDVLTVTVTLGDVDLDTLTASLLPYEVDVPRRVAFAVQDHGFSPIESNRLVRFRNLADFLEKGGDLFDRVYLEPPAENTRMWAVKEALPDALVMDTGTAAILGALLDDEVARWRGETVLVINTGNAHTLAAVISGDRVLALYEHHTGCLTPPVLADHIRRFVQGTLGHREIFDSMGHGVVYASDYEPSRTLPPVAVTGPRRAMASELSCRLAVPFGDMMLSGCFGLIEGARRKWNIKYTIGGERSETCRREP